jgi:template-activating factor I
VYVVFFFYRQDLTVAKDQLESKGRKRGLEEAPSFFVWFSETESSSDPIAEIIKDDIWPNPLQFFLVS